YRGRHIKIGFPARDCGVGESGLRMYGRVDLRVGALGSSPAVYVITDNRARRGTPRQSDAVATRSFALESRPHHVLGVAPEADLSRRTSGAARRKSNFERDALAGAYGERKNNSADRISISA